jgi:outer membrane cobalamin receptor
MPFYRRFLSILFLSASALAWSSDLSIKVVDPQSAPVPNAQVEVVSAGSDRVIDIRTTSAQGLAQFHLPDENFRVHVLAPTFAEQWREISAESREPGVTVQLQLAVATETVTVTATRTPSPAYEAGAAVDTLNGSELETMRPVAANDALRFLPGAIVATSGQRGGLASLFVRGGDSRYNKVIVDGVPVNDPGGIFDFGTLPLFEDDRVEFLRGAQSTLYGSDAMSSVVQSWSRTGTTRVPELRFGADAGKYGTENGYASLAGANGAFDCNVFGNQFNTTGSGPNDDYSSSLEGVNLGAKLNEWASLRLRARHDNSISGVQNEWNFNGRNYFTESGTNYIVAPDLDQRARQNNFLGSLELSLRGPSRLQQQIEGYDYTLHRTNTDSSHQPDRMSPFGDQDFQFNNVNNYTRAGFLYQGNYSELSWTQSTFGYEYEDEHGITGNLPNVSAGIRRNHAVFGQQMITFERLSLIAGGRFAHNESFGDKFVPRASLTILVLKAGQFFSGTRLVFSYATGIKEPTFAESFGNGGGFPTVPNHFLKPEEARAFEAGFEQRFRANYSFSSTYFNNLFRNRIDFNFLMAPNCPPQVSFCGQYVNINEAIAHGIETVFRARLSSRFSLNAAYTYTSSQVLKAPLAFDPILGGGRPLLRRPKHSATLLLDYVGQRWGGDLAGSFVGRRADSDFYGFNIDHAPAYVLVNAGGWYAVTSRVTAYVSGENLLNQYYNEVVGYPALGINFRAGIRFRVGGD